MTQQLSRNSGLKADIGTFGFSHRLSPAAQSGVGRWSPNGRNYYASVKRRTPGSDIPRYSVGSSERFVMPENFPNVGPCSYHPVSSFAKHRTSLDGPHFCSVTLKGSRSSSSPFGMGSSTSSFPGPGDYKIDYKKLFSSPKWVLGGKLPNLEEEFRLRISRMCTSSSIPWSQFSKSNKFPGLRVAGTFGSGKRFQGNSQFISNSPEGEVYYSHNKILRGSDYMKHSRSCSLGSGKKTEFEKLTEEGKHVSGPGSFSLLTSAVKRTSSLDGLR